MRSQLRDFCSWIWIGPLLFSVQVFAFDLAPEYRGLDKTEALTLDNPRPLDAEYSSDFLTYQRPLQWEPRWHSQPVAFDMAVGSLGYKDFLVDGRLKFTAPLTERLKFQFLWLSDRDLEDDFETQILEMSWALSPQNELALYGHVSRDKAEDDMGLAWVTRLGFWQTRIYATFLDFQRNQRNHLSDRWQEGHGARAFGFVGRTPPSRDQRNWSELSWRQEPKAIWLFPDQSRHYEHQRNSLQIRNHQTLGENLTLATRSSWDDKFESESFPTHENQIRRQRLWLQTEIEAPLFSYHFRPGLNYFWRRFQSLNGDFVARHWIPSLWWIGPSLPTSYGSRQWEIGYDVSLAWTDWSGQWQDSQPTYRAEHRLNTLHRWRFSTQGELDILLTFDLDRFGSGETWEGGAARMNWFY